MNAVSLIARRRDIARKTPRIGQVIKGSLVVVKRYCGKPNCRCRNGLKHRSLYISRTVKGRQRLRYIPKRAEGGIKRLIGNYRKLKSAVEKISDINTLVALTQGKAS